MPSSHTGFCTLYVHGARWVGTVLPGTPISPCHTCYCFTWYLAYYLIDHLIDKHTCSNRFVFRIELNLHLVGRKMKSPSRHFHNLDKKSNIKMAYFCCLISSKIGFNLRSLNTSTGHVLCNRSRPNESVPCRRLIQRREATIARGRTTGAAAARLPKALGTA